MPELAEVEFYRRRWQRAAEGAIVVAVEASGRRPYFRGASAGQLRRALSGARLGPSSAAAKQMLFRFGDQIWLGIHLGMTGQLRVEPPTYVRRRHDHLVLRTARQALVLHDPRRFGRVDFHRGPRPPDWWSDLAPAILSADFDPGAVAQFLRRRAGSPLKAVLLMQERFPGIGNWMADEILWRAALHPGRRAGSLNPAEVQTLWRECRRVCRMALRAVAGGAGPPPATLNIGIPKSWLFHHRWTAGGRCPRTGVRLARATIGGRTTCWSPARQRR